jgi:RNA polymerase sigma-70 factor, ECF subfamily
MEFEEELISLMPNLRAYARRLVRHRHDAEDLVQDVVVRAWGARHRFEDGSNMRAWLFTILRNRFYNSYIVMPGEVVPLDSVAPSLLSAGPEQEWALAGRELQQALTKLHPVHREVLLLSVDARLSYDEISQVTDCAVGTVKSRVFRARRELASLLGRPARAELRAAGDD